MRNDFGGWRVARDMADSALQHQLQRIQLLLVLVVSLLSGVVFGRDPGGEVVVAILSFAGLSLVLLAIVALQAPVSE